MADAKCTCATCGAQFKPVKGKRNIYCEMACYRIAQRAGNYKRGSRRVHTCTNCGTEVSGVSRSKKRNGEVADNIFCGRQCYNAYRSIEANRVIGECKFCGKDICKKDTPNANPAYCSMECRVKHKRAKPKNCMSCGCWFTPIKWHSNARRMTTASDMKTCSTECHRQTIRDNEERKIKIGKAMLGEKHPNWLGGAPMENRGYRGSGWQSARRKAIKRDKFRCTKCGITQEQHKEKFGRDLEVNHKRPFWQFNGDNQKANRLSNLETLCRSCHQLTEWEYRRENAMQKTLPFG